MMYRETVIAKGQSKQDGDVNLIDLKLHHDSTWGYTLEATYQVETSGEVLEYHIPKIRLNINEHSFAVMQNVDTYFGKNCWFADLGDGPKELICNKAGDFWVEQLIKSKTKEMTLEEIEKKLGHKVKIVNK